MDALDFDYAADEVRYNRLMEPIYREAIASLALPHGSRGLDAGCGPGGLFPLLDEATGRRGSIVGLDGSTKHLAVASEQIERHGLGGRVRLQTCDLRQPLDFAAVAFDWVWGADALYRSLVPDPAATVAEFRRVTAPGGIVALFFLGYRGGVLPGYPELEHRLDVAAFRRFDLDHETEIERDAGRHQENALAWLVAAGLDDVRVTSYASHDQQPLRTATLDYLASYWFPDRRDRLPKEDALRAGITEEEWRVWSDHLANAASPDYLLRQPTYHCLHVGTLAVGRVPAGGAAKGTRRDRRR